MLYLSEYAHISTNDKQPDIPLYKLISKEVIGRAVESSSVCALGVAHLKVLLTE